MFRRIVDMLNPWAKARREAKAAQERAETATTDAEETFRHIDAAASSLQHRVFVENHIVAGITHLLEGHKP